MCGGEIKKGAVVSVTAIGNIKPAVAIKIIFFPEYAHEF